MQAQTFRQRISVKIHGAIGKLGRHVGDKTISVLHSPSTFCCCLWSSKKRYCKLPLGITIAINITKIDKKRRRYNVSKYKS
jgi:hypothetical protein